MLSNINGPAAEIIAVLLQAVPAMIGAFVGGPVLARELETGTFRYAWTQGFGRWRWTLGKLVLLAITVTAAAGAFSVLFSWYYQPYLADGWQIPFGPLVFGLRGVAFAAWTLAAFAIAALAGMLIRRAVPAIAATLAVYAGLAFATGLWLREHYITPLVTHGTNLPGSAWIIGHWYAKDGRLVSRSAISQELRGYHGASATRVGPNSVRTVVDPIQYLTQHGYMNWTSYQPASRFWPFQWIEGGWLLALSVLAIAATVWLARRRAA
jgi:ABC-2 family transporter protein